MSWAGLRPAVLLLVLLALIIGPAVCKDEKTRAERDELLIAKLKIVEAAQKNLKDTKDVVFESKIVDEAPAATLWAADGDIATTGACAEDVKLFCRRVEPGEERLADCLGEQLEEEEEGDDDGRVVSPGCRKELDAFRQDVAGNINKNIPLARACRDDVKEHCSKKKHDRDKAADILACLRRIKKKKLSERCAGQVFKEEVEEAKMFAIDPQLREACGKDAETLCADYEAGNEGQITHCLIVQRAQASSFCQEQLRRIEVERSGDVRLDRHLFRACSADIRRFCKDIEPGNGRVLACLEEHRHEEDFSDRCRGPLEGKMERESADYELNAGLREYCEEDIEELCAEEIERIQLAEGYGADSQVITCLETQRDRIRNQRCQREVHRQMQRESEDIRFDHTLARACFKDVREHCEHVVPGSARVIQCLEENRSKLSRACSASLFDHEVKMAEDIDFKYPMRQACVVEIDIFCRGLAHGHNRVGRCLQDHLEDADMSDECRMHVQNDELVSSRDFRLNFRLQNACMQDVNRLCGDVVSQCSGELCGGKVLSCLRFKMGGVRGEECRNELFHFVETEVRDYHNDVGLAEGCKVDIVRLCEGVEPGQGRVHACLRAHMDDLSEGCLEAELLLNILQARDVRLRPQLQRACSQEEALFCEEVEPGKGRVFRCLAEHMGQPGFSEDCRQEVTQRVEMFQRDYRLDAGIGLACHADAVAHCNATDAKLPKQPGLVLRCLVQKVDLVAEGCQRELSRGVRMSLWAYKRSGLLTRVCDADVTASCPTVAKQPGMFTIGRVGRCLSKQVAEGGKLSPACKDLITVAAPRDARSFFDSSMSLDAVAAKVAQIAHSAGMSSTFVDPKGSGMGAVTITGWVAFLCLCSLVAVVVGIALFALQRAAVGRQHQYTRVMKQGDV